VLYFQHTQEGHKTPVEIRPIPSLVNQMCLVYDASRNKFVPQDLATYVENTPSFENKIREVAGTAELVVEDGSTVIAKVNVYDDSTYLPLVGNNPGDQAFATDTNILYIWDGSAWQQAGTNNTDDLTEGTTNLFFTDARADARAAIAVANLVDSAPTTLDTLNELAAALGDDPNFATTVSNNIGTKLSTADFDSTADTWLATKDTDDLTEGTNQYFTQARVQSTPINAGSLRGTVNNATIQYGTNYSGTPVQGSFFFDSLNQKLKVYTGSAFVDAVPAGSGGGGGDVSDANATFAKYTYTITGATNSVSGADDNLETLSYTVSSATNVEAYVNGVKQTEGASNDYVATTGTSVTFTYNIPAGSTVDIQVYELLTNDAYYLKTETYTRTETNSQISTALAGLVDSAPTTLDTLNELAAALGDDPNFATTVTNSIADKLPLSGGTLTGQLIGTNARFDNTATTPVRVHINNSGTNDYGLIYADTATAYKNLVINPNGGNVGIGTSNPSVNLEVSNSSNPFILVKNTTSGSGLYIKADNDGDTELQTAGGNNNIVLRTAGNERVRLDELGKMGIGTSDLSDARLSIFGTGNSSFNAIQIRKSDSSNTQNGGIISFAQYDDASTSWTGLGGWDNGSERIIYMGGGGWGTQEATEFRVYTGSYDAGTSGAAQRMEVDASGNFAFGSGGYQPGNGNTSSGIGFRAVNTATSVMLSASRTDGNAVRLNYNGVGTSGGSVLNWSYNGGGVGSVAVDSNGTTYNTTSDRRLKENIELITDGKDKIMAMKPSIFNFIEDENKIKMQGFIAQEMKEVVPEAVTGDPDGDEMMSMDYGRITPVIVAALQDALKEIEELKTRINELENK